MTVSAATLTCYNDVTCYSAWTAESNAVARILLSNGDALCTGSLLNNTAQDYKPYLLTAFHCMDSNGDWQLSDSEKADGDNWAFQFQYRSTTCNGSATATTYTYNQAYFRAAYDQTDALLMELKAPNVNHTNVTFLGWDRATTPSTTGTVIHHPAGDRMKISFDNDALTQSGNFWNTYLDDGSAEYG
jgi:hypothetical protein